MQNFLFQTTIYRFSFFIGLDEPVQSRKRKPPTRFEHSYGSDANFRSNYRQTYFEALDSTITTISDRFDQDGTSIYFKIVSLLSSVVLGSDPVIPEELSTLYDKDINWDLLATQLKLNFLNDF